MKLATLVHGAPTDRPPLVIAHGLYGSGRNWGAIARRLAEGRQVVAVDMRNHGDSPRSADHGYPALARDLGETIEGLGGPVDLLGHSMGGKAAMTLALTEPRHIRRLVVADIAPVSYGHSQLAFAEAMRAVDLSGVRRRGEVDAALAGAVEDASLRAFFLQSLSVSGEGVSWKLNLDALIDQMPQIMGFPDLPGTFAGPTLFLTGQESDYVRADHWPRIRALFPAAEHREIPRAAHWLHADAPEAVAEAIIAFLIAD